MSEEASKFFLNQLYLGEFRLQQQISKKLFRGIFFHDRVCMPLDLWLVKCEKNPT